MLASHSFSLWLSCKLIILLYPIAKTNSHFVSEFGFSAIELFLFAIELGSSVTELEKMYNKHL